MQRALRAQCERLVCLSEKEIPWSAALGAATRRAPQGWPTWAGRGGTLSRKPIPAGEREKPRGICTQMIANRVKLQIQAWRQMLRRRARRGRTRSVAMSVSGDGGARCWRCRKLPARVAEQQRGGRGQLRVAEVADEAVEMESGGERSELPQSRGMQCTLQ